MSNAPIGIFDSGIGGTSVFKEVRALLPSENFIYLADSKNAPFGIKSEQELLNLSIKNTEYLFTKGCKLIIVACNTATTNSISYLREHYAIPFIGIEPAIKPASLNTATKTIGILATKGTLSSALFHKTSDIYAKNITVIERVGEGIVELIEAGNINSSEMDRLLSTYINPMIEADIDYLVLGCTHYPYLIPLLKKMLPPHIKIIDSGLAVAKQTKAVLINKKLLNTEKNESKVEFYTNGNPHILTDILNNNYSVQYLEF